MLLPVFFALTSCAGHTWRKTKDRFVFCARKNLFGIASWLFSFCFTSSVSGKRSKCRFLRPRLMIQIRFELTFSYSSDQLFNWANNNYQHFKWSLLRIIENNVNMTRQRRLFVNVMKYQSLPPSFATSLPFLFFPWNLPSVAPWYSPQRTNQIQHCCQSCKLLNQSPCRLPHQKQHHFRVRCKLGTSSL